MYACSPWTWWPFFCMHVLVNLQCTETCIVVGTRLAVKKLCPIGEFLLPVSDLLLTAWVSEPCQDSPHCLGQIACARFVVIVSTLAWCQHVPLQQSLCSRWMLACCQHLSFQINNYCVAVSCTAHTSVMKVST
jgi:hypothetical protein